MKVESITQLSLSDGEELSRHAQCGYALLLAIEKGRPSSKGHGSGERLPAEGPGDGGGRVRIEAFGWKEITSP